MPFRRTLYLTAAPLLLLQSAAQAQDSAAPIAAGAAPLPNGGSQQSADESDDTDAIVIVGTRARGSVTGDIPAQNILDSRDVRATGATTVSELLDALAPQIGSAQGRGGEAPVLLLNGQRISGFQELRDIPTEAIERVEILPEEVALKYGYSAIQKVVNIVLRQHFRSTAAQAGAKAATDGGYTSGQAEVTRLMIDRSGRTSFDLRAEGNGKLTEAERDITAVAGVNQDSLGARTLIGSKRLVRGSATANRTILGDVSATLNGEVEHVDGRSLLGRGLVSLDVLARDTRTDTAHLGTVLNGDKLGWHWSVVGNVDLDHTVTLTDRDNPSLQRDRARQTHFATDISAVANGNLFKLPAGDASATLRVGAATTRLDSERLQAGLGTSTALSRTQGNAAVNLDLPISRHNKAFSALGNLTANANAEVQQLSDFGTLTKIGTGLNWSPADRLNLLGSWSREDGAPTIEQLGDPILATPATRIFDFTTGQSLLATVISGGNPALNADRRTVTKLSGNWQPIESIDWRVRAEYVHSVIDRPVQNLFGPTAAIEAAFPDRFVRDSTGLLISADLRPVNFDQARKDSLRIGFDFTKPLKSRRPSQSVIDQIRAQFRRDDGTSGGRANSTGVPAETRSGGKSPGENSSLAAGGGNSSPTSPSDSRGEDPRGGGGGRGGFGGGGGGFFGANRGRLTFSLTDTLTFVDKAVIGPGLPVIDYRHGDAAGLAGGTPLHLVEAQAGWANNGIGARVSANWRSGTKVTSLSAGVLDFAPLATFDLRLFANLGEQPEAVLKHPWLRGSSVRLEVTNLFNSRPRVSDAFGTVPLNYQPDLLDPLGRTVMISIRKLFLPPRGSLRGDGAGQPR